MGQDALEDVPYPISANGQQLISRVITGNTSTHPPPRRGTRSPLSQLLSPLRLFCCQQGLWQGCLQGTQGACWMQKGSVGPVLQPGSPP